MDNMVKQTFNLENITKSEISEDWKRLTEKKYSELIGLKFERPKKRIIETN